MAKAKDVANVYLALSEPEVGDAITNLKIQKLLYYAQGFHLAMFGSPFFDDEIVNWEHGPVIESLYYEYRHLGANPLPVPPLIDGSMFSEEQINLIAEVNEVYGQFSAWKLRNLTHEEAPWKSTERNQIISKELLKSYFSTQLR